MKYLSVLGLALVLVLGLAGQSFAQWFLDFEWGLGHDGEVVASGIPGLQFTTTDGYDWLYCDVTTGGYNATNNLGGVWGTGEYYMEGYVSTWLGTAQGSGRIDFLSKDGSFFTAGYSSYYNFYLEAYDEFGNLLDSETGISNTKSNGGTGLGYLTVSSASNNIAYVLMHDSGNYWTVDNISGNASDVYSPVIPEPSTLMLLGTGLLGLGAFRFRRKK